MFVDPSDGQNLCWTFSLTPGGALTRMIAKEILLFNWNFGFLNTDKLHMAHESNIEPYQILETLLLKRKRRKLQ